MARIALRPPTEPQNAQAVFDGWFERHGRELRSYSARLTGDVAVAEDVVQETFARAWSHIDTLREREEIRPWLYRVARNLCMDTHRSRRRVVPADALTIGDQTSGRGRYSADYGDGIDVADPIRHVERREEREAVREALTALTPRHQDALYLRDIEGMAYDELGRRHGLSGESARALIARARRRLRDELKTMGNGVFGAGLWVRSRLDGLLRRTGADRIPVESLAAVMAQNIGVAAAVLGLTLGSGPGAPAPSSAAVQVGATTSVLATRGTDRSLLGRLGWTSNDDSGARTTGGLPNCAACTTVDDPEADPLIGRREVWIAPGPEQGIANPYPGGEDPHLFYLGITLDPEGESVTLDQASEGMRQACGSVNPCEPQADQVQDLDRDASERLP